MSNNSKLKGRVACETHDCYPAKRSDSGRVLEVKWVPKAKPKFESWVSVYSVFTSIADTILDLPEGADHDYAHILINDLINTLYAQHEGEDAWDIAYEKWIEPSDDDEEV